MPEFSMRLVCRRFLAQFAPFAAFAIGLVTAAPANAIATYDASVFATVTVSALPAGVTGTGSASLEPVAPDFATFLADDTTTGRFAFGDAVADPLNGATSFATLNAADPSDLQVGDGYALGATVGGSAGASPGFSVSRELTDGFLTFVNSSGGTATVTLGIDWMYDIGFTVGSTAESAGAGADIFIDACVGTLAEVSPGVFGCVPDTDIVSLVTVQALVLSDGIALFGSQSDSDSAVFSFDIPDGKVLSLTSGTVNSGGFAKVPEPAGLTLVVAGLTGLWWRRRSTGG